MWRERPLRNELLYYAVCDVRFMLGMADIWLNLIETNKTNRLSAVKRETGLRISKNVSRDIPIVGRNRARRDFDVPMIMNDCSTKRSRSRDRE